jgi:hypothetical protein
VRYPLVTLIFAGILLCAPEAGHAQQVATAHHLGAQLRAFVGPAFLYAVQDVGNAAVDKATGFGVVFNFALGSMVSEDLALNMDLALAHSPSAAHGVLDDSVFSAVHLGAGLTYWWMPANVFLAASLGMARTSVGGSPVRLGIEIPVNESSDVGIGTHLALGKQFWLSRRFCLGATLSLLASAANNPVGGRDTARYAVITTAALTATLH